MTSDQDRIIYLGRRIKLALRPIPSRNGPYLEREVVLHPGAVALVPLVDPHHVCLVRNRRHAVGETLLEVPAGTIDPGESPLETARRELTEETGYTAGRIQFIRSWFVSPGFMNEVMHLFLCDRLIPGKPKLEPDEELESVILPWSEAVAMARDGRIRDAKTILALLLLEPRP